MKNIAIFDTALGTSNVGDEIILDSIYHNMSDVFSHGFSLRLATHVNNFSWLQMLRNNGKVHFFRNADWKFVCGTNLIAQTRVGKINPQWQLYLSNLPIYRNCVLIGVGTTKRTERLDFLASYLYRRVLSKQYLHSVRDELTKNIVESLGCKAINTGCPTLWNLTEEHCRKIPRGKADACIFSVSGYKDQIDRKQDQKMLDILCLNYDTLFAWIQTTDDESYLDSLTVKKSVKKIYSLSKYRELLQGGNVDYVGTRLHGGVFALQNGCRSIIISIDHRADGFHETNNLPILKRREIDSLDGMINSNWSTEIKIDESAVKAFKSQFV